MGQRICSTPGCDRPAVYATRMLCKRCYKRATHQPKSGKASPYEPDVTRFEKRIVPDGTCWRWTGGANRAVDGYGVINLQGRRWEYAHRWSYGYHVAPIPAGLEIDHLCHNTLCVNPWHLEPVTRQVNAARTRGALKTHCKRGHEFTPENTIVLTQGNGRRQCRACARILAAATHATRVR